MPYSSSHIQGENGCLSAKFSVVGDGIRCRMVDNTNRPSVDVTPAGEQVDVNVSNPIERLRVRTSNGVRPIKVGMAPAEDGIDIDIFNAVRAPIPRLSEGVKPIRLEIAPAGKRLSADMSNAVTSLGPRLSDLTKRLKVRCSAVCSVGTDEDGYEIFMVEDGVFLLYDGNEFSVLKRKW